MSGEPLPKRPVIHSRTKEDSMKSHRLPVLAAALLIGSASVALAQQSTGPGTPPSGQAGATSSMPSTSDSQLDERDGSPNVGASGPGFSDGASSGGSSGNSSSGTGAAGTAGSAGPNSGSGQQGMSPGMPGQGMSGTAGGGTETHTASGKVDKIDKDNKSLTLDNGDRYSLSDVASLSGIDEGDDVDITYRNDGGDRKAMTVIEGSGSGSSTSGATTGSGSASGSNKD
ncbi:DUF1344 domain-containing protein [Azospirillum sp. ST 5-10]|uniref:DUF1344 domain-containing protein n=1 Tax=Azospirillum sp. ST 5-10 TaxID=3445776 RepID=UPI003F4A4940